MPMTAGPRPTWCRAASSGAACPVSGRTGARASPARASAGSASRPRATAIWWRCAGWAGPITSASGLRGASCTASAARAWSMTGPTISASWAGSCGSGRPPARPPARAALPTRGRSPRSTCRVSTSCSIRTARPGRCWRRIARCRSRRAPERACAASSNARGWRAIASRSSCGPRRRRTISGCPKRRMRLHSRRCCGIWGRCGPRTGRRAASPPASGWSSPRCRRAVAADRTRCGSCCRSR